MDGVPVATRGFKLLSGTANRGLAEQIAGWFQRAEREDDRADS